MSRFPIPIQFFGSKGGIWGIECKRVDIFANVQWFEFRIRIKQRTKENINGHPSFQ